jgi:hypothetical protein
MRKSNWSILAVAVSVIFASLSQAQTNSCISTSDGFWDEARLWSLGKAPSIKQSAILITNAASETVTIDGTTATKFRSTMTVSNLDISPYQGSTDTLYLDNTGTTALHILNSLTIGLRPDYPYGGGGQLISTNSTLIVDGLLGGLLDDDGMMVFTGGSLITTNCSLYVAGSFDNPFNATGVLIFSNAVVQARDVTIASATPSGGALELIGGKMTLSSSLNLGTGIQNSRGSLLVANGGLLVVTNAAINSEGSFREDSSGIITVTNATLLARDFFGGELSIEAGTVTLEGSLFLYYGDVSVNDGKLVVTNNTTTVSGDEGYGAITIEEGLFLAREILVGTGYHSEGSLTINGGITQLSSYLQVGNENEAPSGANVFINGGQLIVTNGVISVSDADPTAKIRISGGQLVAETVELGGLTRFPNGGMLIVSGGSVTVSDGIKLGDCVSNTVGQIFLSGGILTVTNAAHTGFIDVQNGQVVLSGGVLQVDKLLMTNSCGSFVHTGGTLIAGSVILDPNAFQITSVTRTGNDFLVTWLMGPGQTNALQVSNGGTDGSLATNGFTDIFVVMNNTTAGTLTNYLDVGAATNKPSRFYRARLAP